jgi:hypothetical protein
MKITIRRPFRPDVHGRRPDVRPCLRLPRGRGFTRGRVFTVRGRSKNRVRADMGRPRHVRTGAGPCGREKKKN